MTCPTTTWRRWKLALPGCHAATAELAGLTVLHVDKHYELIAEITGQRLERLAR